MNPVAKPSLRLAFGLLAITVVMMHFANSAHAQSSLGIGVNDGMAPTTGPFAHILMWINLRQQEFYRALAGDMKAMRQDGSKIWLLIGLSFAYGIFHAAGPGHGKAVISSYMVANEVALRRGILLSFVSALLQGLTAVAVMLLAYFVLRGTAVSMTDAAWFMEIMSFVFVTLFGAWLLWRKLGPAILRLFGRGPAYSLSAAHAGHSHGGHSHGGHSHAAHGHSAHAHSHALHAHDHHDHAAHDHSARARFSTTMIMLIMIMRRARSATPAVTRMRPIRRCCRATASTGARPGRRWPLSASAPVPAR